MTEQAPRDGLDARQSAPQTADGLPEGRVGERAADGREGLRQSAEALPPYSGPDAPCPKCGNEGAGTQYRAPRIRGLWEWNDANVMRGPLPERLQRNCDRCDFCWDEALTPPTPAHNAGPTVAECAEADARWWGGEKTGEE
ncbi:MULTISPECIES: hypothetical protein [Streptomyces]|uniref:Uncharacterized protein n=2 Tax=Streptomyces TaxID=1883 RepID=A0A2U9NZA1_STRAS|nr:hypothetical protein [Streptomyces actuosus]AWT42592.1 hypothetical protein DMT42_09880 [Streptomyces actuosus]MBM4819803.1 hypothetical protein [Streptomyces actuosus]